MNRLKIVPYALGAGLLLATLIGAKKLGNNGDPPAGVGKAGGAPRAVDGLVAKGNVSAEHEPMPFFLPAHIASGRIAAVLVKNGQSVKKGDPLVRFDDWQYRWDLTKAEAALQLARWQQNLVVGKQSQHEDILAKAKLAVTGAETAHAKAKEMLEAIRKKLDFQLRQLGTGATNIEKAIREEPELLKAEAVVEAAETRLKEAKIDLQLAEKEPLKPALEVANYHVAVAQADVDKARQAVERCVLSAELGGIIERVAAAPGQVMYPQSRTPMFWLIPEGPRYVKAEIVPEFAHKIRDKDGVRVVISDDSSPDITYEGVVEQIGSAFLPKSGGVDLLNGKPTNVLEVSIRVIDPAPPGKPALRVGQPVRVTIP